MGGSGKRKPGPPIHMNEWEYGTGLKVRARLAEGFVMTITTSRWAAMLAAGALCSLGASPAAAQNWGGGWDGGNWGHHRNHVDAGDVLAGILIIGGIAAIASAVNSNKRGSRNDRSRYPGDNPDARAGRYGNDNDQQWQQNGGVDSAVNRCTSEVSRGSDRGTTVESINRDGDGWRVQGRTGAGGEFTCSVDGNGQIRNVQVDGHAY